MVSRKNPHIVSISYRVEKKLIAQGWLYLMFFSSRMPPTAAPGPRSTRKETPQATTSNCLERLREFQLKMHRGWGGGERVYLYQQSHNLDQKTPPKISLKVLTKLQLWGLDQNSTSKFLIQLQPQNLDQNSASKSWSKFSFKILIKIQLQNNSLKHPKISLFFALKTFFLPKSDKNFLNFSRGRINRFEKNNILPLP